MTGFGEARAEEGDLRVAVSVRTVNHRNLDLVLRLPEELRPLERQISGCLGAELERGRVEVRIDVTRLGERPCQVGVSHGAVEALRRAAEELADEGLLSDRGLAFADLLRLPEVVKLSFAPPSWSEEDRRLVLSVVESARDQAAGTRRLEGERLAGLVASHLQDLEDLLGEIERRRPEARQRLEDGFRRRLDELLDGPPPSEERLAQEVALLVERSDVQEEIDRLRAHLDHGRELLRDKGPVGRRLEFLGQELLREVNTLGAKSRDLPILRAVLDAKSVCDRLREQVQNIE
jgi:uncharacterized protein (TIGR00255 family)